MPSQIHPALYLLSVATAAGALCFFAWRFVRAMQARPRFDRQDIIFQEWFASGYSQKTLVTKIGGARNCLRLVVTRSFLSVTAWFPLSLIASFYDVEHVIPLSSITSVKRDSFMGRLTFLVTFTTESGAPCTLRLIPKQAEAFAQSLGPQIMHETQN